MKERGGPVSAERDHWRPLSDDLDDALSWAVLYAPGAVVGVVGLIVTSQVALLIAGALLIAAGAIHLANGF